MLDVIKGICIIMVILTHVSTIPNHVKKMILYPFTILPAVPMFIMLNAYSLSLSEDRLEQKAGCVRTISDWFEKQSFFRRIRRFLIPYAVAIIILFFGMFYIKHLRHISFRSAWIIICRGGSGPGGYYVLIILQILMLFPFIRYGFNKKPFELCIFLFVLHLAFEILSKYVWGLSYTVFKSLIFRFLGQLALGLILYQNRDSLRKNAIPHIAILVGGVYIINGFYFGYKTVLSVTDINRNLIASLYSFGMLAYLLQLEPHAQKHARLLAPICYIGKASYHIMLTQMVYYYFARTVAFEERLVYLSLIVLVDLIITISVGCLFYYLDNLAHRCFGSF